MDRHDSRIERRRNLRMPLGGAEARIHVTGSVQPVAARCTDLGVGGLTLRSSYVPQDGEALRVEVSSPGSQRIYPPLNVRVVVRRCHMSAPGDYEIGVEIVEVLD